MATVQQRSASYVAAFVAFGVVPTLSLIGGRWRGDASAAAVWRGLADVIVGASVCEEVIAGAGADGPPAGGRAVRAARR
jgi:hypothetical protein